MGVHDSDLGVAIEGGSTRQALVEDAAEGVHVRSRVDGQSFDLLGSRVIDRADEEPGLREPLRSGVFHDAEVGQEDTVRRRLDQDVRRLDVAVHEIALVCRVERACGLLEDVERSTDVERAFTLDQRLQVSALDIAHRDEELTVRVARVVDRDDVRVVDLRCAPRLALETLAEALVLAQGGREELEGNLPPQPHVFGQVDDAHPSPPEQLLEPVAGDRRSNSRSRTQCPSALTPSANREPDDRTPSAGISHPPERPPTGLKAGNNQV